MKKEINKLIKTFPTRSIGSAKLSNCFLISKNNSLRELLKNNWENFLFSYQSSQKKMPPGSLSLKSTNFFYLKKEKFFHYNYLLLAKLVDLIGDKQTVKNQVRNLIQIYSKHLEVEKLFQMNLSKKSIFLCWISYLVIHQISKFIKRTSSFLSKSNLKAFLTPVWKKKKDLDIQNNKNFLFLKCNDFLLLKWYENRISVWFYKLFDKSKKTQILEHSTKLLTTTQTSSTFGKLEKFICCPENDDKFFSNKGIEIKKTTGTQEKPNSNQKFNPKIKKSTKDLNTLKQKYIRLIKNILQKDKITTQGKLIQNLNRIIGNWDTFILNNITKKKSLNLNLILYQLLWRWGLARHRKQKAKWIKNRYWSFQRSFRETKPGGLFFSVL